ncbi:MAG: hypothetical protein QM762_05395 [Chryseolinea sp.]
MRKLPQVERAEAAGSLRRGLETVGDLDFHRRRRREVAPVVDWFVALPDVKEVTAKGETKASVRFESGLQADLRIVPAEQFVFALHHFTGSKDHNVQMRQRALAARPSLQRMGTRAGAEGEGTVKEGREGTRTRRRDTGTAVSPRSDCTSSCRSCARACGEIETAEKRRSAAADRIGRSARRFSTTTRRRPTGA